VHGGLGPLELPDAPVQGKGDALPEGRELTCPAFLVDGFEIWGATAMVLAEFLALLDGGDLKTARGRNSS